MMTLRPRSRDELLDLMDRLVDQIDDLVDDLHVIVERKDKAAGGDNETENGG